MLRGTRGIALAVGGVASVASCRHAAPPTINVCDAPITSWLVAGPFALDTGSLRLDRSDIGDPSMLFVAANDSVASAHDMRWRAESSDSIGRVDLYSVFREPKLDDRAAYALTYVTSPEARTVLLAVESDDDVVIWLNGRRVLRHDIGRELQSNADTISLALAPGVNRLLYRIVNRGGGFGLGGRLLSGSRDPVGGLRTDVSVASRDAARRLLPNDTARAAARRAMVTLGPVVMAPRALLRTASDSGASTLETQLRVCATRWTRGRTPVTLAVGGTTIPLPRAPIGEPLQVAVDARWDDLAQGVLGGGARVVLRSGNAELTHLDLEVSAGPLLAMLSRPIQIEGWRASLNSDPSSPRFDLRASTNSIERAPIRRISADLVIPRVLSGLTLDAEVAEFGATPLVTVNRTRLTPDTLGRATICSPCRVGESLALSILIKGQWWDAPRLRAREAGWTEVRDGATWARYFTGDSSIATPDSALATRLLHGALDPAKAEYRASIAQWLARLGPASARIRRDTIDVVGHSHIDAAWLWRWREGEDEVQRTWGTATKLMAKYPDMHFAGSSAQYYEWMEQYDPALLARIQALAKENRWDPIGGWWVEADANLPSGESLVRQALYGQRTFVRLFGKPARVAWLANSFGFAWSLPQILRKSGFEFFVTEEMRWNDTNHWPPSLNTFWWEGPDGSRVFTDVIYAYDHDLARQRLAKEFVVTRDSSASPRMMTVYGVGDHGGGPTMAMLDRARDLQRISTFPVVRGASPDSSLSRMRADAGAGPVLRDELYLEYHRGTFTTQAAVKRRNRELETLLGTAEAAAALASTPYPHDSLRTAWKRLLFTQFHDILPGSSIADVYRDASIDYAQTESIARRTLKESLLAIAARMDTRSMLPGDAPYLVFNATGHARTGVIRVPRSAGTAARDATGRTLASTIEDSVLEVRVPDVPSLGASLIFIGSDRPSPTTSTIASAAPNGARVLENASLRVELDPATGNIARFYDKVRRKEMLAPGAASLLLLDDRPLQWEAWNIDNLNGARAWIDQAVSTGSVVRTPLGSMLTVHRQRDSARVTEQYTLRDSPARLDIKMSIDWHESRRLLKLAIPFAFRIDSTRAEIPYASIARPTRPATRRDSARFEVPMQRWVDASAQGAGIAIINDAKYGYSASGDTIFITLLRSPKSPDPNADMGLQHVTLSIVPHSGDWRAPEIQAAAEELNAPMAVQAVSAHAGGANPSWLTVEPWSVSVGALKRAEDDERIILRLVETSGRATSTHVRFAAPVDATEVDMLERPIESGYHSHGATLDVPLRAFEIKTLAVQPSR